MYVYLFGECLVQNQPPTSPATPPSPPSSPGGLEMNYYFKECSVPNSSSELIFVKIRAESGPILAKIRAKLKFWEFVVFLWLVYVQRVILPFGKQPNNALNMQ